MSEPQRYQRHLTLAAPPALVAEFFKDAEACFRLNPEWEVLAFDKNQRPQRLKVRYERSEQEADYSRPAPADFAETGGVLMLQGEPTRTIHLTWTARADGATQLVWEEAFDAPLEPARLAELNLWGDAIAGYLRLAARSDWRARLARWLLDRIWLRMSPTGRRVALLVIAMEGLAFLLLLAILIIYRWID